MKRISSLLLITLFISTAIQAQNNLSGDKIAVKVGEMDVEDSDSTIKSDYYSAVSFVRSGKETYSVTTGIPYHSDLIFAEIENTSNKYIWKTAYIKGTNQKVPLDKLLIYSPDESQMRIIVKQVFPNCIFGIDSSRNMDNQQLLRIYMSVDPDTEKVLDISFSIRSDKPGAKSGNTLFSLPPSKLRQLEELIKGNVHVEIREGDKYTTYNKAVYRIYFKHFKL